MERKKPKCLVNSKQRSTERPANLYAQAMTKIISCRKIETDKTSRRIRASTASRTA